MRVATIPSQWIYVNTSQNPADQASRGLKIASFVINESEWPEQLDKTSCLTEHDSEVKTSAAMNCMNPIKSTGPVSQLVEYYSSWHKLKKATTCILRLREALQHLSKRRNEYEQIIKMI